MGETGQAIGHLEGAELVQTEGQLLLIVGYAVGVLFLRVAEEHVLHDLFAVVHQTGGVVTQVPLPLFVLLTQGLVLTQSPIQLCLCRFVYFVLEVIKGEYEFLDSGFVLGDDVGEVFLGLGLLLE